MKLWIDDVRPAPEGYIWCKSVDSAKYIIQLNESAKEYPLAYEAVKIKLIDIDHDAGDYSCDGGDYIKLLDWLEATGRSYPIHIHSMNPAGVQNMRAIIQHNGWQEV